MIVRSMLLVLAVFAAGAAHARTPYVLNAQGPEGVYSIYRVDYRRGRTDTAPILSPGAAGFDAAHIYWPSAVMSDGALSIYATVQDSENRRTLGLWRGRDAASLSPVALVMTPENGETHIGAAHVVYDRTDHAAPYKMWFGVVTGTRQRPRSIVYATSSDGVAWTRRATVLTADQPYEARGFQLDYVCRDRGAWRMFLTATDDPNNVFRAIEATARAPDGPFQKRGVVFEPGGVTRAVLESPAPESPRLLLEGTAGLEVGRVYVLTDGAASKRVVVRRVVSDHVVLLHYPVAMAWSGPLTLVTPHYRKVTVSAFFRDGWGRGRALLTGWGALESGMMEYVFEGVEKNGSIVPVRQAPRRFRPLPLGAHYSFENPSPVTRGPDC